MTTLADANQLTFAILDLFGLPNTMVREVNVHSRYDDLPEIEVTYLHVNKKPECIKTKYRVVNVELEEISQESQELERGEDGLFDVTSMGSTHREFHYETDK